MKQLSGAKQKWVLSLALLAVLGTQSYFQMSSNTLNSYELASREPAEASPGPKGKHFDPKSPTGISDPDAKKETGATSASVDPNKASSKDSGSQTPKACAECVTTDDFQKAITSLELQIKELKSGVLKDAPKVAVADKKEEAKADEESPKERRERIAQEKAEKKQAKEDAKKEKEEAKAELAKEKKDQANEDFQDAMKTINDDCSDSDSTSAVQCIAEKMATLLKKVSKDKDAKPDNSVVQKAFSSYFSKAFVASMQDPSFEMSGTLDAIMKDIPNEYSVLKNNAMNAIAKVTADKTAEIKKNYVLAQELKKQNKLGPALEMQQAADSSRDALKANSSTIYKTLLTDVTESKDFNAMTYLRQNYYTNINDLMTSLDQSSTATMNVMAGINTNANGTRSNARGGNASNILVNNANANTLNNALQNNGTGFITNGNSIGTGITVGAPNSQRQIQRIGIGQ
ncbi:MAG: hypothetical protein H7256_16615 [Bdellovibrio sp.]|nr:hypothetical protein [Bdellovibrio sp.]